MDTGDWTLLSLWIHIPIVTAWIGLVMFDVFAATGSGLTTEQRGRMLTWSRGFVLVAIVVIMVTGVWQTMKNPLGEVSSYSDLSTLRKETTYGFALFIKHGFVVATFALTLLVRFVLAPRLLAAPAAVTAGGATTAADDQPTLRLVRWLSIVNLLACLGALIFATRMVWELH